MLLIRFILLALASLNCVWAVSNFLNEYLGFVIQSLNPFGYAAPFDPATLLAWLAIAAASGSGAYVLLRASYMEQRRAAKIIAVPETAQQAPDMAA
jgi:hypothetical protein